MSYGKRKSFQRELEKDMMYEEYIESLTDTSAKANNLVLNGLYDCLKIPLKSQLLEIKSAYKALVLKAHPDKGGTTEEFNELQKAYKILSNPQTRAIYDEFGLKAALVYHYNN